MRMCACLSGSRCVGVCVFGQRKRRVSRCSPDQSQSGSMVSVGLQNTIKTLEGRGKDIESKRAEEQATTSPPAKRARPQLLDLFFQQKRKTGKTTTTRTMKTFAILTICAVLSVCLSNQGKLSISSHPLHPLHVNRGRQRILGFTVTWTSERCLCCLTKCFFGLNRHDHGGFLRP